MNNQEKYQKIGELLWSIMAEEATILFCTGMIYLDLNSYSFRWLTQDGKNKSFDFDKVINDNLKSEFKLDFIGEFENKQYKLITNHNLNTSFFKQIGAYLNQFELSYEDIYLAGINYYQTNQKVDFEGIKSASRMAAEKRLHLGLHQVFRMDT